MGYNVYIINEEIKKGDKIFIHHSENKVVVARWPLDKTMYAGVALCDMVIGHQVRGEEIDWTTNISIKGDLL